MAKSIALQIVTPRKVVFDGEVENFTAPGVVGPFQVLFNHAPIVAALQPGVFKYKTVEGREERLIVSGGFLELHSNVATVLADAAEEPREIDVERARRALLRAQERLKHRADDIDQARASAALARAQARLHATQHN
jgi:F-type H+-transporting ATPase subunit epsilon